MEKSAKTRRVKRKRSRGKKMVRRRMRMDEALYEGEETGESKKRNRREMIGGERRKEGRRGDKKGEKDEIR